MTSATLHLGPQNIRRQPRKLPSIRRHLLTSALFMGIVAGATALYFQHKATPEDAIAMGEITIEPIPLPAASDNLNGDGIFLPDMLIHEVAPNENPTEKLDALGNPIPSAKAVQTADAKPKTSQDKPVVMSALDRPARPSGPKTILIDGKPIGGKLPSSTALPVAPIANLHKAGKFGRVPAISANGRKAVKAYARPFTPTAGKKQVSIVIGGLGIDRNLTRRIIKELPGEITLSFAAHAPGLQSQIALARRHGHEVLLELPMEGHSFNAAEPGANRALRTDVTSAQNADNLEWLLSRAQGYYALTNYNGDKIINDNSSLEPIFKTLSASGLGFIYDNSSAAPGLDSLSRTTALPLAQAHNIIDEQTDAYLIETQLNRLESQALSGSAPIGFGFGLPETFMSVKSWTSNLDKSYELAPASYALSKG